MNLLNRRLREIQHELLVWTTRLKEAETIEESLAYQSKIDLLEKEEKEILERCDVIT